MHVALVNYSPCAYFVWFVTLLVLGACVHVWKLVQKDEFTNLTQRKAQLIGYIDADAEVWQNTGSEDDT